MRSEMMTAESVQSSYGEIGETCQAGELSASEMVDSFLTEHRRDYYSWQLILFFAQYPYVRFNRLAVISATNHNDGRRQVQLALNELISHGLVKVVEDNGTPLYSLAEDMRMLVLKLTGHV